MEKKETNPVSISKKVATIGYGSIAGLSNYGHFSHKPQRDKNISTGKLTDNSENLCAAIYSEEIPLMRINTEPKIGLQGTI